MPTVKTSDGYNINYEVHGDLKAEHTIIFAHGNGNCIRDWHTLGYVKKLASNARLILMDALGYGESDKPYEAKQYTPERRAEDVITVLNALSVDKAHFFGGSVGGSLGFVLADLYPDRFASFMIGSAHPYGNSEAVGANLFGKEFRDLMAKKGMKGFVEEMEEKYLGCRFQENVRVEYLKNDPKALGAANTPVWPDRSACLKKIKVPVLLFAGDKDPVSKFQEAIAKDISDSDVVILENTDHAGAYWEGAKVAALLGEFLHKKFETSPLSYSAKL